MVHKAHLGTDARGNYRRRLGKRADGQIQTFYLGTDRREAERRNAILETEWARTNGVWDEESLRLAKQIAATGGAELIKQARAIAERTGIGLYGLHQAFRDYQGYLAEQHKSVGGNISEWGKKVQEVIGRCIDRHEDISLTDLNLAKCEEMLHYWKNRPLSKRGNPITAETARKQLTHLRAFFRWLGRQEKYNWKRPADLLDLRLRVPLTSEEIGAKTKPLPTYTHDELTTVLSYASDRMRLMILLALNCAFKQAEIAGLQKDEIFLDEIHPHYKIRGNFIRRIRRKSIVYGEWKLWDVTTQALVKAMAESNNGLAIVTSKGTGYNALTKGNNHNQRIANMWKKLVNTIPNFRYLPFTSLVDTAVSLVRDQAGGEVAAIFKCHGSAVSDELLDLYSNRPFDKVFAALDTIGKQFA